MENFPEALVIAPYLAVPELRTMTCARTKESPVTALLTEPSSEAVFCAKARATAASSAAVQLVGRIGILLGHQGDVPGGPIALFDLELFRLRSQRFHGIAVQRAPDAKQIHGHQTILAGPYAAETVLATGAWLRHLRILQIRGAGHQ